MTTLDFIINRSAGSIVTSYDVWAKFRAYPQNDGDGVYVGNYPIDADVTSVIGEFETPNGSTDWKFIAIPRFMDQVGLPGQLDPE